MEVASFASLPSVITWSLMATLLTLVISGAFLLKGTNILRNEGLENVVNSMASSMAKEAAVVL